MTWTILLVFQVRTNLLLLSAVAMMISTTLMRITMTTLVFPVPILPSKMLPPTNRWSKMGKKYPSLASKGLQETLTINMRTNNLYRFHPYLHYWTIWAMWQSKWRENRKPHTTVMTCVITRKRRILSSSSAPKLSETTWLLSQVKSTTKNKFKIPQKKILDKCSRKVISLIHTEKWCTVKKITNSTMKIWFLPKRNSLEH
jgi:hypothetical protein